MNLNVAFLFLSLALIFVSAYVLYREAIHAHDRQDLKDESTARWMLHRETLERDSYTPQEMQLRRLQFLLHGKKFAGDVKIADIAQRVEGWTMSDIERLIANVEWALVYRIREAKDNHRPIVPAAVSLADFEQGFQRTNWHRHCE